MKKRKDKNQLTSVTVLRLKLQVDAEQSAELTRAADLCRRGRNAGSVNWLLRQHGLPETREQSERICKHAQHADKPKSESTKIYHAVNAGAPSLSGTTRSMLANQVNSFLSAKLDWREGKNEDGSRPKRADAILKGDARPPYFTAVEIPVRAMECKFTFGDRAELSFGVEVGRKLTVQISTKQLKSGHKAILHELAAGKRKLADSRIILRDDEWFWMLPVAFEQPAIVSDRVATLTPIIPGDGPSLDRPFALELPDRTRPWSIGDGRYLLNQTRRVEAMRKMIGWRYRQRFGAGHGRKKIDQKMKGCAKLLANIVGEVRRRMICDVVRQAERAGCGTVHYREPSLPVREKCWFAFVGLEWDWTRFAGDLGNALARKRIKLVKSQLKMKEVSSAQGTGLPIMREAGGDSESQSVSGDGQGESEAVVSPVPAVHRRERRRARGHADAPIAGETRVGRIASAPARKSPSGAFSGKGLRERGRSE